MNDTRKGAWCVEIPLEVRGKCRRGFSSTPKAHLAHPASTPDPIGNLFGWLIILKERTTWLRTTLKCRSYHIRESRFATMYIANNYNYKKHDWFSWTWCMMQTLSPLMAQPPWSPPTRQSGGSPAHREGLFTCESKYLLDVSPGLSSDNSIYVPESWQKPSFCYLQTKFLLSNLGRFCLISQLQICQNMILTFYTQLFFWGHHYILQYKICLCVEITKSTEVKSFFFSQDNHSPWKLWTEQNGSSTDAPSVSDRSASSVF